VIAKAITYRVCRKDNTRQSKRMALNIQNIKQEQLVFLRNSDIFSISERGVTTANATGTLSGTKVITISTTGVKNIRTITVGAVSKSLGTDYTVVYGTASTIITFGANQTGNYVVSHDYGSDKIYPDFPRDDLTIGSYPRIAIDILSAPIEAFGIGGTTFITDVAFTIVVYADKSDALDGYIQAIKTAYIAVPKDFYYLSYVKPTMIGPTLDSADKKSEIMQKNIDMLGMFNVE